MESIDPWLDATEVRRLADRLLAPAQQAAPAPVAPSAPSPFREVKDAPPAPSESELARKLGPFRAWMREQVGARHVFLLEGDDEVIFDDSGHAKLANLARGFVTAAWRHATARSLQLKIGAASVLEIIPVEQHGRRFALGAVIAVPLKKEAVRVIAESLQGQLG